MAIAYVQQTCTGTLSATGANMTATVANAPAAGARLIARILYGNTVTLDSISDSKGNTWAIDKTATSSWNYKAAICSTPQDVGTLVASDTIVFHFSGTARASTIIDEFSGVLSSAALDEVATATAATTARDGGTTAATTQADELVVACFLLQDNETSLTPDGSYQSFATPYVAAGGGVNYSVEGIYLIVSATGAQHPTATGGKSAASIGVTATYKAAAAPASVSRMMLLGVG